jgi:Ca-activated chloride channel family protein
MHMARKKDSFRFVFLITMMCALGMTLLVMAAPGGAQPQEGRPRHAESSQGKPTPPVLAKPTPTPTPGATPAEDQEVDPKDIITVDTNLVNLNVRVIDRNNRPVNDVTQGDFRVYEDGVLQSIQFVNKEEIPVSYGLAVDTSGSLRSQLPKVIEAAKTIVNSNKPGDETFLVRFISSDKIETVQDFTPNKTALLDGLDTLYTEGGQTAVIDAVYLSAERVADYKKGDDSDRRRRALIVVTDGEDRASYYSQEKLFQRLREEDVQIYVIGFVNELESGGGLIRKGPREKAINLINQMTSETGGRAFYPNSLAELPAIAQEITKDLRMQYVVSYYPTNKAHDGTYRAVRVTVADEHGHDKRIAITRPGYTSKRGGGAAPSAGVKKSE